jgi:transposase
VRAKGQEDKDAALRQSGALNPRPQNVTDSEFLSSEFFDPRDLVQVKYEMLRRGEHQGKSVTDAAASFGLSRTTYYETRAAVADNGLLGLLPQRPGPRRAHKLNDEVLEFIEQAMNKDPALRSKDLVPVIKERFALSLHSRSIDRALEKRQKKRQTRA